MSANVQESELAAAALLHRGGLDDSTEDTCGSSIDSSSALKEAAAAFFPTVAASRVKPDAALAEAEPAILPISDAASGGLRAGPLGAGRSRPCAKDYDYPDHAADFFGEYFAHRLRWGHAVNSRRALCACLQTSVHMLEADVAAGPLLDPNSRQEVATSVMTKDGEAIIMAHYPTERSSDLSLENFIQEVLRHNDRVMHPNTCPQDTLAGEEDSHAPSAPAATSSAALRSNANGTNAQRSPSKPGDGTTDASASRADPPTDEAAAFAQELNKELETQSRRDGLVAACVGTRRDNRRGRRLTRKGVKLDFKQFECVEPTIRFLKEIDAAQKLGGHLWLNADVFAGPGALLSPMDAKQFVRLCAETMPEAVLSLSWGSSMLSTTRFYTHDMVERMIELCMTPFVPHWLPNACNVDLLQVHADADCGGNGAAEAGVAKDLYLTPAASCRHITFAVAADYALASAEGLRRILDSVPGTSLTIFTGFGSLGITPSTVQDLIREYGKTRLFLDLRVTKPWRTCTTQGSCTVQ